MKNYLSTLQEAIAPYKSSVVNHPVYSSMQNIQDLQLFAEQHVFAVWDFMSLLKKLQIELTCTTVPWMPKGSANTRFLINEIVTGEECDVDQFGNRLSHFELYLKAMEEMGANTQPIHQFLMYLQNGTKVHEATQQLKLNNAVSQFLFYTFHCIYNLPLHAQAAVFTFGREDLIPNMFLSMVTDLNQRFPNQITTFKYYLDRHIEVDGDHHSQLATEMVAELCGNDSIKWTEATAAATQALIKRKELWDYVAHQIMVQKKFSTSL